MGLQITTETVRRIVRWLHFDFTLTCIPHIVKGDVCKDKVVNIVLALSDL
jgi:hypothetical protein